MNYQKLFDDQHGQCEGVQLHRSFGKMNGTLAEVRMLYCQEHCIYCVVYASLQLPAGKVFSKTEVARGDAFLKELIVRLRDNLLKGCQTMKTIIFLLIALCVSTSARGEPIQMHPNMVKKYVDAIYIAEGGKKAKKPFGILSIPCNGYGDCRKICENTVRNNYRRWQEAIQKSGEKRSYLDFLADRYCPPSADPVGNRNWKKNVGNLIARK